MVVLDTCALLWWTLSPQNLSRNAQKVCTDIESHGNFVISSISLWEVGLKIKKKQLDLGIPIDVYCSLLRRMNIEIVPVGVDLWLENLALKWDHKDPVDRTIVALAKMREMPLLTEDREIRRFYKKSIW